MLIARNLIRKKEQVILIDEERRPTCSNLSNFLIFLIFFSEKMIEKQKIIEECNVRTLKF